MVEVIPAIIPQSLEDLKEKMALVDGISPVVQIDVCDGRFVPSKCWPYINDKEDFQKILDEQEEFPFLGTLDFEADLMIEDPEVRAEDWIHAGAKRIILHIESGTDLLLFVKDLRKKYGYLSDSIINIEIGIGINIDTRNDMLDQYLIADENGNSLADFVQFMGIKKIGYQHQEFDGEVLEKIRDIRARFPGSILSVDGGVNFENAHDLVEAGINRLVSGSTIYTSDDIRQAIEELKNS